MDFFSEGIITGVFVTLLAMFLFMYPYFNLVSKDIKEECELTLPRNQQCVFVAIPEPESKNNAN